jgi:hypothetical protein
MILPLRTRKSKIPLVDISDLGSNAGITTPSIRTDGSAFFDLLENTRPQLLSFNAID